jgi:tRNA-uridine 2-sulfurtransferase
MKNWSEDFKDYGCTWAQDAEDARKVAQVLDIPFYVWNFEKEYHTHVVEYFLKEYQAGRTPNPDILCNSEIKFKVFLDKALTLGADFVATGHYARVRQSKSGHELLKGLDPAKDQSYFLYRLTQKQLSKVMFPIGEYIKADVRGLARKFKLPTHAKKDSQGICFIGQIDVVQFLREHIKATAGEIVTVDGELVGQHSGLPYYTIGQREGIGVGGTGPYYVVNKEFKNNILRVTNNKNDPMLWGRKFQVSDVSWTNNAPILPFKARVSIRYSHQDYAAEITDAGKGRLNVVFDEPQRAITPGQSAVVYNKDILVGGGVIENAA